jgi:hemerythrin-like domain-containing protein
MKATRQLKKEHESISAVLIVLDHVCREFEATGTLNKAQFEGILEFLTGFVDKYHHGKEEDVLFPALMAVGIPKEGLIAVLLYEHKMARDYVKAMSTAYARYIHGDRHLSKKITHNAHRYVSLLKGHIERENNVLLMLADSFLSEKGQAHLFQQFKKMEEERMGVGQHSGLDSTQEILTHKEVRVMSNLQTLIQRYETQLKELEIRTAEIKHKLEIVSEAAVLLEQEGLSEDRGCCE